MMLFIHTMMMIYQDRVVVGVSRMGDGGKRSTTSSTWSHLGSRGGEGRVGGGKEPKSIVAKSIYSFWLEY